MGICGPIVTSFIELILENQTWFCLEKYVIPEPDWIYFHDHHQSVLILFAAVFVCGTNDTMLKFKLVLFTCVGVMALFRMWSLISAHGLHYIVFVLIWYWLNLTISFGTTSLPLGQSNSYHDYPSASDATNNINTTHQMHSRNFRTFSREISYQLQKLTLINSSRLRPR